ncbi:MAG: DUF2203 family protein [Planctomycetaceae bacterium]|nr:DUF2203 family protein [Planctomycetaceae bacterium]
MNAMVSNPDALVRDFTPDRCNAMLPLVKAIVWDIVTLATEITSRNERIESLENSRTRPGNIGDFFAEEFQEMEDRLRRDCEQLGEYIDELNALGLELHDAEMGEVHFPTVLEGKPGYYTWKLGEDSVFPQPYMV